MRKEFLIELLEDGEKVSLYSPKFKGEEYTEFERFLLKYINTHSKDVQVIVRRIDIIKENGAEDRYFRYEGTTKDRVMGLPSHIDSSNLRVYCINIDHKILILGNGGIKTTATYEEDSILNDCVETLQKIDFEIKEKEKIKEITIKGTKIIGPLTLFIEE